MQSFQSTPYELVTGLLWLWLLFTLCFCSEQIWLNSFQKLSASDILGTMCACVGATKGSSAWAGLQPSALYWIREDNGGGQMFL